MLRVLKEDITHFNLWRANERPSEIDTDDRAG